MQSVCSAVLFLCVCLVAPLGVVCLSTGAPAAACLNGITPDRTAHGADPRPANTNPYLLDISSLPVDSQTMMHTYEPNTTYRCKSSIIFTVASCNHLLNSACD